MIKHALANCRTQKGHSLGKPCRYSPTVKWKISNSGPLHSAILFDDRLLGPRPKMWVRGHASRHDTWRIGLTGGEEVLKVSIQPNAFEIRQSYKAERLKREFCGPHRAQQFDASPQCSGTDVTYERGVGGLLEGFRNLKHSAGGRELVETGPDIRTVHFDDRQNRTEKLYPGTAFWLRARRVESEPGTGRIAHGIFCASAEWGECTKLTVINVCISMASPFTRYGLYCHCLTASKADRPKRREPRINFKS